MSKSKPLEYSANEPAFLQRLKAQNAGLDGRHERPVPRAKRAKVEDEEDMPTYVLDGSHEVLSSKDYAKMKSQAQDAATEEAKQRNAARDMISRKVDADVMSPPVSKLPQSSTTIGQKKRKAVTVVEDDDQTRDEPTDDHERKMSKKTKKTKPIKLSFDDGDT